MPRKIPAELRNKLQDSGNQLYQFRSLVIAVDEHKAELVNEAAKKWKFKPLEDVMEMSATELDSLWPGTREKYNNLMEELKKADMSESRLESFFNEVWETVYPEKTPARSRH